MSTCTEQIKDPKNEPVLTFAERAILELDERLTALETCDGCILAEQEVETLKDENAELRIRLEEADRRFNLWDKARNQQAETIGEQQEEITALKSRNDFQAKLIRQMQVQQEMDGKTLKSYLASYERAIAEVLKVEDEKKSLMADKARLDYLEGDGWANVKSRRTNMTWRQSLDADIAATTREDECSRK